MARDQFSGNGIMTRFAGILHGLYTCHIIGQIKLKQQTKTLNLEIGN